MALGQLKGVWYPPPMPMDPPCQWTPPFEKKHGPLGQWTPPSRKKNHPAPESLLLGL